MLTAVHTQHSSAMAHHRPTEKPLALVEHRENEKQIPQGATDFATLAAEEVNYGQAGAKAFLTSPYVFGAALLASMGGFSYGYG